MDTRPPNDESPIAINDVVIAPFNIYAEHHEHERHIKIGEGYKQARVIRGMDQLGRYMVDFGMRRTKGKGSNTLVVYAARHELRFVRSDT